MNNEFNNEDIKELKINRDRKNGKSKAILPLSIAISIILGILIGKLIYNKKTSYKTWGEIDKFSKIEQVIQYVKSNYVDEISYEELEEEAISKFLESLDPHTKYLSPIQAKVANEELMGNFDGIGIQFNIFKDTIYAVKIIPHGPAEKAGLLAGDRIIKVNDSLVAGVGIKNDSVMKLLKGEGGSIVKLLIYRKVENKEFAVNVIRAGIPLESINAAYIINNDIAYIKIESFAKNTYLDFWQKLSVLKSKGAKSVIVDLRDNGGGFLDVAINILDEFFADEKLLLYTDGNVTGKHKYKSTKKKKSFADMKVAVLINELSASASEIFAGAIQDNDRGIVIGRRSFGKGLVQESVDFNDGSVLRLTISRYYTPSGRCIQKKYNGNANDYDSDIVNRYLHGEFYQADSISFNDTTKYYTTKGRVVYGGGGIMPDFFVAVDTSYYSELYEKVFSKNLCYLFALEFVDNNRQELKKCNTVEKTTNYLYKEKLNEKFWKYVEENNVKITENDLSKSKKFIENILFSYIIRDIHSENDFYERYNKNDKVVLKAINEINKN